MLEEHFLYLQQFRKFALNRLPEKILHFTSTETLQIAITEILSSYQITNFKSNSIHADQLFCIRETYLRVTLPICRLELPRSWIFYFLQDITKSSLLLIFSMIAQNVNRANSGLQILYCRKTSDNLIRKFQQFILQEKIGANSSPKYFIAQQSIRRPSQIVGSKRFTLQQS